MNKDYSDFVDRCYKSGKDLEEMMLEEIENIISEAKEDDINSEEVAKQIMKLFHATVFEW